jgi:uncharacterized protein YhfF
MGALNEKSVAFWQAYLATTPDGEERARRFYEVYQIGDTAEDADYGAQLILAGAKTTTSGLLWEYEQSGDAQPFVGALSLVENGQNEPVCVVETVWVAEIPLSAITDIDFIVGYGEWGETVESWQQRAWAYYAPHCRGLGLTPQRDMPMLCERFQVVYR